MKSSNQTVRKRTYIETSNVDILLQRQRRGWGRPLKSGIRNSAKEKLLMKLNLEKALENEKKRYVKLGPHKWRLL